MHHLIAQLLSIVDQAYNRRSWHGTNLRGAVRTLSLEDACWRPGPGRHNAWELMLHAAYWKYVVRRALTGEKRGQFPLKGSDWFVRPTSTDPAEQAREWPADVALLDQMHAELREVVAKTRPSALNQRVRKTSSRFQVISGIAAHDLYHAGQIQLLKRLAPIHEPRHEPQAPSRTRRS